MSAIPAPAARPTYEQVATQIATMIQQQRLPPGSRLLTERQLGEKFEVSRNTVREALKVLSTAGLVRVKQGSGVYVNAPTQAFVSANIALDMSVDPEHILSLLEFRLGLEQQTSRFAAQRITPRELTALEVIVNEHRHAAQTEDHEQFHRLDIAFHCAVAEGSHNPFLASAVRTTTQLQTWAVESSVSGVPGSLLEASAQHQRVCDAIRRGDATQAESTMSEHLEAAKFGYQQEMRRRMARSEG